MIARPDPIFSDPIFSDFDFADFVGHQHHVVLGESRGAT